MATMRPVIVALGLWKVDVKALELTRLGRLAGYICGVYTREKTYPPMRPLSYPIKRKPRHVNEVTAVKRSLPSSTAMVVV